MNTSYACPLNPKSDRLHTSFACPLVLSQTIAANRARCRPWSFIAKSLRYLRNLSRLTFAVVAHLLNPYLAWDF
jgi:hypothetical protein